MDRTKSDYYRILFPTGRIGKSCVPRMNVIFLNILFTIRLCKVLIDGVIPDVWIYQILICHLRWFCNNWQLIEMKLLPTFVFWQGPTLLAQHHSHALTHHVHHGRPALDRHGHSAGACVPFISNSKSANNSHTHKKSIHYFVGIWYSCTEARPTKDPASSSFSCTTSTWPTFFGCSSKV